MFLRVVAPAGAIARSVVSGIVRSACRRAGLAVGRLARAAAHGRDRDAQARRVAAGDRRRCSAIASSRRPRSTPRSTAGRCDRSRGRGRKAVRHDPAAPALDDYLRIRRRLGFKLKSDQRLLEQLRRVPGAGRAERITTELAVMWARLPVDAHPHRWRQRLGIVRGFARYLATLDPDSEVPSRGSAARPPAAGGAIHLLAAEISGADGRGAGADAAAAGGDLQTVIGLMATHRPAARRGARARPPDVDLTDGALHVRAASTSSARCRCTRPRPGRCATTPGCGTAAGRSRPRRRSSSTRAAAGCAKRRVQCAVREADRRRSGWREPASAPARGRTTSGTLWLSARCLTGIDAGEDVDRRMPELSTFLGHYAGDLVKRAERLGFARWRFQAARRSPPGVLVTPVWMKAA